MTDISKISRRDLLGGGTAIAAVGIAAPALAEQEIAPDFTGTSVLITGTSSGFGRLTAIHLARLGATVVASMRNHEGGKRSEAQELVGLAKEEKLKLTTIEIDVTDDEQVLSGVTHAEKIAGGALDVLVNNAGIGIAGPVELSDTEAAFKQFDVNLFGYHRMARAVLPAMRARGKGQMFHVSSQLGRLILPNLGMYCSSKFAVEAMFESMAYELAPFGIENTIIQPGGYPTKIWENGTRLFDALLERADQERVEAYDAHVQLARGIMGGGGTTDPMDVPRAIAQVMSMPKGKRPLRRPVHPNTQGSVAANTAMSLIQARMLGEGPYKNWHKAVTD